MATRRSTRLQNIPPQQSGNNKPDDAPIPAVGKRGRPKTAPKASISNTVATFGTAKDEQEEPRRKKIKGNGKASNVLSLGASTVGANDKISILPPEILNMILVGISEPRDMSVLGRTSKMFYSVMMPRLYGRVVVASMFHAHIAKLIRTLEPLLSIAVKKQLKKEGKYKGQQEKYRTGLNEKAIPACAGYVKQYVEEALKVMRNLEVLDIVIVNESISKAIASLPNLKALRMFADCETEDIEPLAQIKELKHLEFKTSRNHVFRPVLQNSTTTLESLAISGDHYNLGVFEGWAQNSKAKAAPDFVALKSLSLKSFEITEQLLKDFGQAFDFTQMRELEFAHLPDPNCLFFPFLTSQFSSFRGTTDVPISLRTLKLNMDQGGWRDSRAQVLATIKTKCDFIASFDTLTTLELPSFKYSKDHEVTNPGFSDLLLQAILKHKNLRVLNLSYNGISSSDHIPYLDARTVAALVDGLPQLREFNFAPMQEQMPEISRELQRASHLEILHCWPYDHEQDLKLIQIVVGSFLSHLPSEAIASAQNGNFKWEDYYRLSRIRTIRAWDIASDFGKKKRGGEKPEKIHVDGLGWEHNVKSRPVRDLIRIHLGYDPDLSFLKQVEKRMS
ncbi:hypothetical protein G7054_g14212 [Neopestalotiopsis clavispora]|nr:hypothetical protein G7054_g14212 [Neopestalotiopsis clavispora]